MDDDGGELSLVCTPPHATASKKATAREAGRRADVHATRGGRALRAPGRPAVKDGPAAPRRRSVGRSVSVRRSAGGQGSSSSGRDTRVPAPPSPSSHQRESQRARSSTTYNGEPTNPYYKPLIPNLNPLTPGEHPPAAPRRRPPSHPSPVEFPSHPLGWKKKGSAVIKTNLLFLNHFWPLLVLWPFPQVGGKPRSAGVPWI